MLEAPLVDVTDDGPRSRMTVQSSVSHLCLALFFVAASGHAQMVIKAEDKLAWNATLCPVACFTRDREWQTLIENSGSFFLQVDHFQRQIESHSRLPHQHV